MTFLPLHSIMFLLILFIAFASGYCDITLHSIMFLLIPGAGVSQVFFLCFTFHNVSINTNTDFLIMIPLSSLHSIMFLLIQTLPVSQVHSERTLHSIMFLLIQNAVQDLMNTVVALHSIMFLLILNVYADLYGLAPVFTFHNVSINTKDARIWVCHKLLLYIP